MSVLSEGKTREKLRTNVRKAKKNPSQTIYHVSQFGGASRKKVHYLLTSLDRADFFSSVGAVAGPKKNEKN